MENKTSDKPYTPPSLLRHALPSRPRLLDLREYPFHERAMRLFLSVEESFQDHTLLVITDRDPSALLEELKPALDKPVTYWISEAGPETWRVLISWQKSTKDSFKDPLAEIARNDRRS